MWPPREQGTLFQRPIGEEKEQVLQGEHYRRPPSDHPIHVKQPVQGQGTFKALLGGYSEFLKEFPQAAAKPKELATRAALELDETPAHRIKAKAPELATGQPPTATRIA